MRDALQSFVYGCILLSGLRGFGILCVSLSSEVESWCSRGFSGGFRLRGRIMDSMNEAGVSNTIASPGTETTGIVKNDGSCIPLRKLGSFEIPAIITGSTIFLVGFGFSAACTQPNFQSTCVAFKDCHHRAI